MLPLLVFVKAPPIEDIDKVDGLLDQYLLSIDATTNDIETGESAGPLLIAARRDDDDVVDGVRLSS